MCAVDRHAAPVGRDEVLAVADDRRREAVNAIRRVSMPRSIGAMTELGGFLYPRTPSGASSIVPDPPWHYSGDVLTVEYRTEPGSVARGSQPGSSPPTRSPMRSR